MKFLSNSMIAAAIVFAMTGCTNPSGGSDAVVPSEPTESSVKLTAADAAYNDYFGYSVSVSGDTAIVGAYGEDDNGSYSGAAYIFAYSGGSWSQTAKLTASDGAANDYFGYSVSISDDIAVVGAYRGGDNGGTSGAAYIFTLSGGNWSQTAKLTADDGENGDNFGWSVSISDDTVIVGASEDDDNGTVYGSAYIFTLSGGSWSQAAKLEASDRNGLDYFGKSVSVSGDIAVVGAYGDDDDGSASGSAYVFQLSGGIWSQTAKLTAGDAAEGDNFGYSVSISDDIAIVGACGDDDDGDSSGSAYIFALSGGSWSQAAKLTADDGAERDFFGISVAAGDDLAVVGSYYDDDGGASSGSAYLYELVGGSWTQTDKLTADDASSNDVFGFAVSASEDRIIVGAYQEDDGGSDSGAAYIFEND